MAQEGDAVGAVGAVGRLARVSAAILDVSLTLPDLLRVTADAARDLLQVHAARIQLVADPEIPEDAARAVSLSNAYRAAPENERLLDLLDIAQLLTGERDLVHSTRQEIAQRLAATAPPGAGPRLSGNLLAARVTSRETANIGWLLVWDKRRGDFNSSDEAVLRHISRVAAAAISQARYSDTVQRERSAREAAETASRLKDEFLAVLSHELRTPLNAILGWAGLVREGRVSGAGVLRAMEVIERNARLQKQMVQDLFETSRAVAGPLEIDMQPTDLLAVVSEVVEELRPAAERKDVRLIADLERAAGAVLGDPLRLQQIVSNLVSNGLKFTPAGGQVCIMLTRVDTRARITVTDTGPGIAPELLPNLFEGSRQARATVHKFRGLGIGLAIARHLTEAHGGTITAASRSDGPGALFTVDLPLHAEPPAASAVQQPRAVPARVIGARILIVEADSDAAELLRLVLEQAGATAEGVASPAEARAALERGAHDMLLVDTALLEDEGADLIASLRATGPEANRGIAAVALTRNPSMRHREELRRQGFDDALTSPFDPTSVTTLVAHVLDERCGKIET